MTDIDSTGLSLWELLGAIILGGIMSIGIGIVLFLIVLGVLSS